MTNNHRCPECSATNTRRCALAYEQATSTNYGPNFNTTHVSGIAHRVSPPSAPLPPSYWKSRWLKFGIPGACLILLFLWIGFSFMVRGEPSRATFVVVPIFLGSFLVWHGWPPTGALDSTNYEKLLAEFNDDLSLYQRLWVCLSCGKIFNPK